MSESAGSGVRVSRQRCASQQHGCASQRTYIASQRAEMFESAGSGV